MKPPLGECVMTASHKRRACDNGNACWCSEHPEDVARINNPANSVVLADELVDSAGDRVLLFKVAPEFVEEEWSAPVRYRFVRTEEGLLSMELSRV
jgi:hypothetical protein